MADRHRQFDDRNQDTARAPRHPGSGGELRAELGRALGPGPSVVLNEGILAIAAIADMARLIDPPVSARRPGRAVRRARAAAAKGARHGGHDNPVDILRCRIVWRLVAQLFAMACERDLPEGPARRRPRCHVRQVAMYLSHVVLSVPYAAVGAAFGRDRTTVVHACAVVEDRVTTRPMTASSSSASAASRLSSRPSGSIMRSSEAKASRKALAGLVGFLARGEANGPLPTARSGRITLERSDGNQREVDASLLKAALAHGLLTDIVSQDDDVTACAARAAGLGARRTYAPTPEGRAALKRWLSDPDSAFQDQHRTLVSRSDPDLGAMTVNAQESPLAALARIKARDGSLFLDSSHVEAGERLRIDFTRGQMQPSLGQRWEPVRLGRQSGAPGGAAEMSEAALSARMRVERALADVGPELSGVLLDVCCFLKGLAEVERERQWPARSAKLMLRTALAALARHYGALRRRPGRVRV